MRARKNLAACIEHMVDKANGCFPLRKASWIKVFVIMVLAGIVCLCMYNYFADPFNYFSREYNEKKPWGTSQYFKVNYVSDHPGKYDCFVIGGSNSGVLTPELIDEYTDYNTYSMSFLTGNWYSYYTYIKFLIENMDAKCIVLHLSSTELGHDEEGINLSDDTKLPAVLGDDLFEKLKEKMDFLLKFFALEKAQKETVLIKENGMADWSFMKKRYDADPEGYIQEYVLDDYGNHISEMENVDLDYGNVEKALKYAKQIKQLCDNSGVELVVISGPVFISKRVAFECDTYYDYLRRLTDIMDIYDFSDITEINANPYNFHDTLHYNDIMGEKVIDAIFGNAGSEIGGIKLTSENVDEYIRNRKEKFEKLLEEYRNTGTIRYQSYDSESRVKE